MGRIYDDITQTVGHTPLVKLNRLTQGSKATVAVKLESRNPLGSVKDRIAVNMISEAEKAGQIGPDSVIVEPTSGNTGIGLAFVCAARGYHLILTMPDSMSVERRKLLQALGADLILTPGKEGMPGAIRRAEELVRAEQELLHAPAIQEPGQSGHSSAYDGRRDMGRHRRSGGYPGGGRRYRGYNYGYRADHQGAKA